MTRADPEAPGPLSKGCNVSSGQAQPLKCYGPLNIAVSGYVWARPTTDAVFDSEDGRFRSRKQTYSETRRLFGLENRGSKWTPDHGKGSLAISKVREHDQVVISGASPTRATPLDERGSRSPRAPEQRLQRLIWTGQAVVCKQNIYSPLSQQVCFNCSRSSELQETLRT